MKLNSVKDNIVKLDKDKRLKDFKETILLKIKDDIEFLMKMAYDMGWIAGLGRAEEIINGSRADS